MVGGEEVTEMNAVEVEKHQRKKKEITMEEFKIALEEEYQNRMIPKKSKNA